MRERILILDGATGTYLQGLNLTEEDFRGERFKDHPVPLKGCNDVLCLTKPEAIIGMHRAYIEAGADMTLTYYNSRGKQITMVVTLYGGYEPWNHVIAIIGNQGYYQDSSGAWVSYGSVKWEGGEYDEMLWLSFVIEEGFTGGDIIFKTQCSSGVDPRGGTILDNGDHKVWFTRTCHVATNGVILDKHAARITPGEQLLLNVTSFPADLEYEVNTSNPAVAQVSKVDNTIQITGISVGKATISVIPTDGVSAPDSCVVTVYANNTLIGDVNHDGRVTIADVTDLIDYLLMGENSFPPDNADVNRDNDINIADVVELIDYLLNGSKWPNTPIEEVIPQEYLDIFEQYMPIYYGNTPPIIEGVYKSSPHSLVFSSHGYSPGHVFGDYYYRFTNQSTKNHTVDFEYIIDGGTHHGTQYESIIQGSNGNFTVFFKVTGTSSGVNTETVEIYSGTMDEGGIRDLYKGFVMLDKGYDPGYVVPVGTVRVIKDGDGWSEATSWPFSKGFNAMPFAIDGSLKSDISMPD